MSQVFIGTEQGLFELESDNKVIPAESGPPTIKFLAASQGQAYALTLDDALWSKRQNQPWQMVNSQPVKEEVWAFAVDSHVPERLYLGVSPALLYQSHDGGKNWKPCDSIRQIPGYEQWTFPPPPHIPHVRSIASDPKADNGLYIGVEEGGIFRSHDQGQTWESLNEGLYWDVHTVVPANDVLRLYATTGNGFYRSDDGGHHWRHIKEGLERSYTVPCVASLQQPNLLFTAAAAGPPPTWKQGANVALYRSVDGGEHWQKLAQGLPSKFDVMIRALIIDPEDRVFAAAGDELYMSQDSGESWQLLGKDFSNIRALAVV
ncbi:sialidase [Nostoc sp. RF31YmG]|nr:sialidase [Nostoc sp. RF31YmG]